jgi:hypothetical protein
VSFATCSARQGRSPARGRPGTRRRSACTSSDGTRNKLYALHAPEVECIAKGKVRTPYEFGVKTSVAVTAKEGVVVGMRSMPGTPYDGHTLHS